MKKSLVVVLAVCVAAAMLLSACGEKKVDPKPEEVVSTVVEEVSEAAEEVVEEASEAVEDAAEEVSEAAQEVVEEASAAVEEGKEAVGEAAEGVSEAAGEVTEEVSDAVEEVVEDAKEAAAGAEEAAEEVSEAAEEVVEEVVEGAEEAVEEGKEAVEEAAQEITVTFSTGETATAIVGEPFEFFFQCDAPGDMGAPAEGEEGAGITVSSGEVAYDNVSLGGPFSYPTSEKVIVTGFEGDFEVTVAEEATQMDATHTIYFTPEEIEEAVKHAEEMAASRPESGEGESPEGESPEGESPAPPAEGESPEGEAPAAEEGKAPEEAPQTAYHSVIQDILNGIRDKAKTPAEENAALGEIKDAADTIVNEITSSDEEQGTMRSFLGGILGKIQP